MNVEKKRNVMTICRLQTQTQIMIKKKHVDNVEYLNPLGSEINGANYTNEIKTRIAMAKTAFNKKAIFNV